MSLGNRLHQLAVRGCLIAGVVLLTAGIGPCESQETTSEHERTAANVSRPVDNDQRINGRADQADAEPASESHPSASASIQHSIDGVAAAIKAAQNQPEPQDQRRRAEQDLKAQMDMAYWACVMVVVAVIQATLTLGSLFFIWRTLVHTANQAKAANISAVQAIKATKAAEAATESAERTAQKQLRAYLSLTPAGVSFDPRDRKFYVRAMQANHGPTPASMVRFFGWTTILEHPLPVGYPFPEIIQSGPTNVVYPDHSFTVPTTCDETINLPFEGYTLEGHTIGNQRIYFIGALYYEDIFGEPHQTKVCWSYHGIELANLYEKVPRPGPGEDPPVLNVSVDYAEQHNSAT